MIFHVGNLPHDTAGYSDLVFARFNSLGMQLARGCDRYSGASSNVSS